MNKQNKICEEGKYKWIVPKGKHKPKKKSKSWLTLTPCNLVLIPNKKYRRKGRSKIIYTLKKMSAKDVTFRVIEK